MILKILREKLQLLFVRLLSVFPFSVAPSKIFTFGNVSLWTIIYFSCVILQFLYLWPVNSVIGQMWPNDVF